MPGEESNDTTLTKVDTEGGAGGGDKGKEDNGDNKGSDDKGAIEKAAIEKAAIDEAAIDEAVGEKGDKGSGDKGAESKPGEYTDFTLPDGVNMDEVGLEAFKPIAKELGLTQEQAQKLVTLQAGIGQKVAAAQDQAFKDMKSSWMNETKADKELGGAKYSENMEVALKAVRHFGSGKLNAFLNETGLGEHPEMIRMMHRIGKAISEDTFVDGSGGGDAPKSHAEVLFGGDKK